MAPCWQAHMLLCAQSLDFPTLVSDGGTTLESDLGVSCSAYSDTECQLLQNPEIRRSHRLHA